MKRTIKEVKRKERKDGYFDLIVKYDDGESDIYVKCYLTDIESSENKESSFNDFTVTFTVDFKKEI